MNELDNTKTEETEKIFCPNCPKQCVWMQTYDKRHRPKIKAFMGG